MDLQDRFESYRQWWSRARSKLIGDLRDVEWWSFVPDPLSMRMRRKRLQRRWQSAVLAFFAAEPAKQCGHVALGVVSADVHKTPYGYSYFVAHLKCLDCSEEWKVQARTSGYFSASPTSNVFRS
jgi:hypothetical protein